MKNRYTQIQFIAANYSRLQGLRLVPVGLLSIFVVIWAMYNQGRSANLEAPILAVVAAALLYWLTDRYYNRIFGQIRQTPSQRRREAAWSIVFSALALLGFALDTTEILPISVFGLAFAASLFADFWRATQSVRNEAFAYFPENFVAAIAVLLVSILPLFGLAWWKSFGIQEQVVGMFAVISVVLILAGIWGHIRITRDLTAGEAKSNDITL